MSPQITFKRLVQVGIQLALVAALIGCTGQAATPTASSPQSSITILIGEDPYNFNAAVGDTGYDALVMHMVLLGLAKIAPDGTILPELAAELPTVENGGVVQDEEAGTMDVTWRLRDDVEWQDGTPVTSDDVIFTYEAITNPDTGIWILGIDYVDSVEKIDDKSFVIHFNAIYPGYLTLFGGEQGAIWPAHYCDASQGFSSWDCGRNPLSDGPYILEEWVTGDHLTFARNPNYYQSGKPAIDQIVVRVVPEVAVRETMLKEGDADVLMWATEQVADELKDTPGIAVSISPNSRWVMRLFLNLAAKGSTDPVADPNPFLSDVRVRQAIRAAIDIDTLSSTIFRGFSTPVWTEFFRTPYICNVPRPAYDPELAKALLTEAGWSDQDGDGTRECHGCGTATDGTLMSMEFFTYGEYGEPLLLTQQLIAEELGAIGIHLDLNVLQGSVLWADYASGGIEQRGDFNLDIYDDGYAGIDPTDFIYQYYASASAEPDSGWNVGRWRNEEFDTLLGEAYTLDEMQRQQLFCQMADILDRELPQILLFSTINAEAYSTRLDGVQANINGVVTWNVADWTLVP